MARYKVDIPTPLKPAEAFELMSHLERFEEWDPGIVRASQITGSGPAKGAVYELVVRSAGRELPMKYEITEFAPVRSLTAVAVTSTLRSEDVITVVPGTNGGSVVTYDADLQLRGVLRLFDPALSLVFGRIGDRAAAGLRRFLGVHS